MTDVPPPSLPGIAVTPVTAPALARGWSRQADDDQHHKYHNDLDMDSVTSRAEMLARI